MILCFRYGKGFGIIPKTSLLYIPNPIYGLIFYTLVAILSTYCLYSINCNHVINWGKIYFFFILNNIYNNNFLGVSNRYVTSILVVTLGIFANIGTIFLALILYKLNNICLVCVSIYILNAILLIFAIKKHRRLFRNRQIKSN